MTDATASNDDGLDSIAAGLLADEFRAREEQRKFDRMLDDHIDGVTYVERDGVTYTEDGRLYEPMDHTGIPGAGAEFLAEMRAKAIYEGERPPASLAEVHAEMARPEVDPSTDYHGSPALDPELQRIVDVNKRNYLTPAAWSRVRGKHTAPEGREYRASTPERHRGLDLGR
ncbi:hypothetical protein QN345_01835 [Cryobacterium sp. 10I1]|uniref:hypothetical protein n=1 Tax=unclassified Cryobacterium TaxID=2649013 RepID=UPI002B23CADA|nr:MULTISPECIES: hypothetical protein [unclassified Cryobacterium]MEB0203180.1 hypothetical protein [Cryobacterium sp. 5I3]MEB0304075.1 hypothetical protein [Cryobacterium sp. 10I1]